MSFGTGLRKFAAAAALAATLAACSGSSFNFGAPKEPPPADPNAFPKDYKPEIAAFMSTYLNNPRQVRDAAITEPVLRSVANVQRYIVCVRYNPRDFSNTYQGITSNVALFTGGRLNQFLPADPQMCAGLNYQRYPEIEALIP